MYFKEEPLTLDETKILEWAEKTPWNKISKWKYVTGGLKGLTMSLPNYIDFTLIDSENIYFISNSSLLKWRKKIQNYDHLELNTYRTRGSKKNYINSEYKNIVWDGDKRFYVSDNLGSGYYVYDLKNNQGWFHSFFGDQNLVRILLVDDMDLYFTDHNLNLFKVSMVSF